MLVNRLTDDMTLETLRKLLKDLLSLEDALDDGKLEYSLTLLRIAQAAKRISDKVENIKP